MRAARSTPRKSAIAQIMTTTVQTVDSGQLWLPLDRLRRMARMEGEATWIVLGTDTQRAGTDRRLGVQGHRLPPERSESDGPGQADRRLRCLPDAPVPRHAGHPRYPDSFHLPSTKRDRHADGAWGDPRGGDSNVHHRRARSTPCSPRSPARSTGFRCSPTPRGSACRCPPPWIRPASRLAKESILPTVRRWLPGPPRWCWW